MKQLIGVLVVLVAANADAQLEYETQQAGLQLSIVPITALHSMETSINGLSLNLWGQNPQRGISLGLINGSSEISSGVNLGLINYARTYSGWHLGVVSVASDEFDGWQCGLLFNYAGGDSSGFQSSCINVASSWTGLQLGVLNYADELDGVQLGLLNIATENRWFTGLPEELTPAFVLLNWSF